jgi:hypothetical protein
LSCPAKRSPRAAANAEPVHERLQQPTTELGVELLIADLANGALQRHSTFTPRSETIVRSVSDGELMRYTVVALIAAAALPLAACGSSTNPTTSTTAASGTSSAPTSSASTPNANGPKDRVAGLIASVSPNTVQVSQQNGNATVDFTNSTKVSQIDPAAPSDVTAGSCVSIRPTKDSQPNGPVTAQTVLVSAANNGQCPQPQGNQNNPGVRGAVGSVSGSTITVTSAGTSTEVMLTADTTYAKRAASNPQAITAGKCIAARGTKDNTGALQATSITVRQAGNRPCPGPRR